MSAEPFTVVLFRRWPKSRGGDVIALFPLVPAEAFRCSSYQHVGQHGAADPGAVIRATRPASPRDADVRALAAELRGIGYRLSVRERMPHWRKIAASRRDGRDAE